MAFEFFFGLFGLISSDSSSRQKSRSDGDWRLFTEFGATLFKDSTDAQKQRSGGGIISSGGGASVSPTPSAGTPISFKSSADLQRPIYSTHSDATTLANNSVGPLFGSSSATNSSSANSIASSAGSAASSTASSTATLIKSGPKEILETISGKVGAGGGTDRDSGNKSLSSNERSGAGSLDEDHQLELDDDGKSTTGGVDGAGGVAPATPSSRIRSIYCLTVCLCLWFQVIRVLVGLIVEKSLFTLDFYYLGTSRIHFLIPALCLAIQAAAVSLIFIRNNDETNWLVPFYSSKDYLIRSRSNFRPRIEDYTKRVNVSVTMALSLAMLSSMSLSAYLIHCVMQSDSMKNLSWFSSSSSSSSLSPVDSGSLMNESSGTGTGTGATTTGSQPKVAGESMVIAGGERNFALERGVLSLLLIYDIFWSIYSTYICFLVSFYFNLICSIMKSRFHGISKIIEDLTESNTTKTTNQARKITTLYLEHNEACELLDESNDFWQYLIFFTYFTYIPAYCYCLYNLFFVDFEAWPNFMTCVIHTHTGFIILLISFSAAGVSTEAHAPYTSLHTLSLIQLPLDVEVNIATFLHRVRGLTIGYSCYDLFAITNGSISNTAAACASYFLIVADFNRSSVFTLAQMNSTAAAAAAAAAQAGVTGGGAGSVAAAITTTAAPR